MSYDCTLATNVPKPDTVSLPTSVSDPGSLSRIPDPDFYPSRIPDPKTATKERGGKKIFEATNFTKLKIILVLSAEEKNLGQFLNNYRTFYPKNCH
jgi:hypothetical protein